MTGLRAVVIMGMALFSAALPVPAFAWGVEGHAIVADIAEASLTPSALRRVTELLHGERMRDVASYADQIRLQRRETTRWHFVNIAPGAEDYRPERDCINVEGQGDCIIAAIARSVAALKTSGEQQELGLKFLIHFVGDVHQPFHAVTEAMGGNQITVTFRGVPSNLHKVWDTDLIGSAGIPPSEYARRLIETAPKSEAARSQGSPIDWAMHARSIGQRAMVRNNADLGDVYGDTFVPVMNEQLILAGIRLAAILNDAFK